MMIASTIGFITFVVLVCESAKLSKKAPMGRHCGRSHALPASSIRNTTNILPHYLRRQTRSPCTGQTPLQRQQEILQLLACWVVIGFVTAGYTASLFIWIFSCVPVEKLWHYMIPGTCKRAKPSIISGAINLVSDVAILALPIIAVARLQMSIRKKLAVSAVFATSML
jgi:hypothetical protein